MDAVDRQDGLTENPISGAAAGRSAPGAGRFAYWAAVATTVLTVVSFGLAITALPDEVPYPFTDPVIAEQWPGDYLWMYAAMLLMVAFVALFAAIHESTAPARRVHSLLGFGLAVIAAAVLLIDYSIQVTVLQPSLEKGQLDGWAMFTMYNPNGVFIALEEVGYVLMSAALLCLVPVFRGNTRSERVVRWLLALNFVATITALAVVSVLVGIDRGDDFEIAVIAIVWSTLLVTTPLMARTLRPGGAVRGESARLG